MINGDLNSILGNDTSSLVGSVFPKSFITTLIIFGVIISVASLFLMVFYILNSLITYRAHKATIEIRDILKKIVENNELNSTINLKTTPPKIEQVYSEATEANSPDES